MSTRACTCEHVTSANSMLRALTARYESTRIFFACTIQAVVIHEYLLGALTRSEHLYC